MLGLNPHRLRGDASRYRRVAVAVAADPAPESEERRRDRRAAARPIAGDRVVERAHQLRNDSKQRLVEDGHERTHLVQGLHVRCADLRRQPQPIDLLDEPSLGVDALGVGDAGIVEALELVAHAPDRGDHGTAPRLGGVRREYRLDLERRDELLEALAAQLGLQRADARLQRLRQRFRSAVALADDPRPMVLLGEIRQVEVAGKRARHLLGAVEAPGGHEFFGVALKAVVLAGADDQTSQLLHIPQQVGAAVVGDHPSQKFAQQADVASQGRWDLLAGCLAGLGECRQSAAAETAYSSESTSARSDASMMFAEQPTVVQRLVPLPDSTSTRVVAAVPASPLRMRTL